MKTNPVCRVSPLPPGEGRVREPGFARPEVSDNSFRATAVTGLILSALLAHPAAQAADLEVTVQGVKDASGQVKLMLFDREEGFRKEDKARQVLALPAAPGTLKGRFTGLEPGRYAVIAYHDENGDGKLNLRLGMFPKEGYGLSNNPKLMGPPKFAAAALEVVNPGSATVIRMDY
jgi:uncharacterized protein (DUF2141 family)